MSERHETLDFDYPRHLEELSRLEKNIHPDFLGVYEHIMRTIDLWADETRFEAGTLASGDPRWKTVQSEPVLSRSQQLISAICDTARYVSGTTGDAAHFILDIPHDQSVGSTLKGLPSEAIEIARGTTRTTHEVLTSLSEQTGITPRRALAAAVTAGVLASAVAHQPNGVEVAAGNGPIPNALIVSRHKDYAAISFNPEGQDVTRSITDAANASGLDAGSIIYQDGELRFIDSAKTAPEEQILAAAIAAQRSEGTTKLPETSTTTLTEPVQPPTTPETPKPQSPEEKFAAEIKAIEQALKHAVDTNGDLGPLNHLVVYSPIFKSRYDLPGDLESGNAIRYLPPANLLNIRGLNYEFSPGTPDKERFATSQTVALTLYTAYAYRQHIQAKPSIAEKLSDSCIRVGDLSADKDHQSHFGAQIDLTSTMSCNVQEGHVTADGPIFWINKTTGITDTVISNPNHNAELDNDMLTVITEASIDGVPLARNILYNKLDAPDRVVLHDNHSNHIHINGAPAFKDLELKHFADGGNRPELNLDSLRGAIFADYDAGEGIDGISKDPSNPVQSSEVLNGEEQFNQAIEVLLTEIASHEGGWDSLNTGVAGDTRLGGEKYQQLLSGRKLSELTISEVLDLQDRGIIMAVGRYQFIPGTLRSAIEATGIDVSRPFDQAAQNELTINYLILGGKRPSLTAYIKGESDDIEKAVNDLCKEWASFPCIDGNGFYDGDSAGNNAAGGLQRVKEISQLLNDLRAAYLEKENPSQPAVALPPGVPAQQIDKDLVLTGDSLTYGLDLVNIEDMDGNGVNVIAVDGRGGRALVAGEDDGLDSIERLISEGKITEAEVIYIAYGTNKLESNQAYEAGLKQAIQRVREVNPQIKVMLPLLFSHVAHKDARNEIITRVANELGVSVINPGEGVALEDKAQVHPGPDGYRQMATSIINAAKNNVEVSAPTTTAPSTTQTPTTVVAAADDRTEASSQPSTTQAAAEDAPVQEDKPQEVRVVDGLFSEEAARNIYKIWFTDKKVVDGQEVEVVDEEALDAWMNQLPTEKTTNGEERYVISFDNLPERK